MVAGRRSFQRAFARPAPNTVVPPQYNNVSKFRPAKHDSSQQAAVNPSLEGILILAWRCRKRAGWFEPFRKVTELGDPVQDHCARLIPKPRWIVTTAQLMPGRPAKAGAGPSRVRSCPRILGLSPVPIPADLSRTPRGLPPRFRRAVLNYREGCDTSGHRLSPK